MEKQLFDWKQLHEACSECFGFGDVTTKVPIGDIPAGSWFAIAWIDLPSCTLSLYKDGDSEKPDYKFQLSLTVNHEIK